ncbi:MAG: thioredoxin [FCB group bacterium]|jgi:thioredoxin 1|nr:thioredoxin [FCB group bacterium]
MLNVLLAVLIGGAVGATIGASRSCETGACPLTSNPYSGALYGGVLGFLVVSMFTGTAGSAGPSKTEETTMSTAANSAVLEVSSRDEFKKSVLEADGPVLVDLWAPWCAPCRAQLPIVEQVASQAGDRARVVKVNVDEASEIAQDLRVSSIPTLLLFNNGVEVKRFVGVQSAASLMDALGI